MATFQDSQVRGRVIRAIGDQYGELSVDGGAAGKIHTVIHVTMVVSWEA